MIKGSILQDNNLIYLIRESQFEAITDRISGKVYKFPRIAGNFNTPLSIVNKANRHDSERIYNIWIRQTVSQNKLTYIKQ